MPKKTALVLGASGLIGSSVVQFLLRDPSYERITLLLRKPIALSHPKIVQEIIDFDRPDPSKIKGDDVFCCLGTTIKVAGSQEAFYKIDCTYPVELGRLARQNGATQYLLVTAMGADPNSRIFYNRVKGDVEQKVAALAYPTLCIFRPSLLLGRRKEFRLGEKIAQGLSGLLSILAVGPLKKYQPIQARKVAAAMVALARQNQTGKHILESDQLQPY